MTTRINRIQDQKRQVKRACKKACSYCAVWNMLRVSRTGYQAVP